MILDLAPEDEELKQISEDFTINESDGSTVKVYEKGIAGQTDFPWLCAKFDDNDEFIVSCYSNGQIEIHDADSCDYICHLEEDEEETKKAVCTMVKWRPGIEPDAILAVDVAGEIRRYSKKEKKQIERIVTEEGDNNRLFALDYSPEGDTFATGGTDHFVRVYDDATMKLKVKLDPFYTGNAGHSNRIFWVSYNKEDPNLIASAGWDSTVIIHDIRKKGPISGILGPYVCGDSLEFHGKDVITGSWRNENQLQVWDTRTTKKIKDIDWDGNNFESDAPVRIFCLARSHHESINSIMIAGGGQSNELRVFNQDLEAVVNITDMSRGVFTWDISHHSDAILFAGGDGVIRVWKVIIYN